MTYTGAAQNIARLLGGDLTVPNLDPEIRDGVVYCLNAALQELYANGQAWISEQTLEINTVVNQDYVELPVTVQALLGPLWRPIEQDRLNICEIRSRAEWVELRYGRSSNGSTLYYFHEVQQQSLANSTRQRLLLYPVPTEVFAIRMDVKIGPPAFTENNLLTTDPLPLPLGYGESLFLPIARGKALESYLFMQTSATGPIAKAYDIAMTTLEYTNPDQRGGYRVGTPCGY